MNEYQMELKKKSDKELLEIIIYQRYNYTTESLQVARRIYHERALSLAREKQLRKELRAERRSAKFESRGSLWTWSVLELASEALFLLARLFH